MLYSQYADLCVKTKIYFVVGNSKDSVKDKKSLYLMVNLMHGGGLSQREIDTLIIYD